jgi:hypothetical protein
MPMAENANGLLEPFQNSITSSLNDGNHPGTLVSGVQYNPAGGHLAASLGNGTGGPANPQLFRGGPDEFEKLQALHVPYIPDPNLNPDWDPNASSQTLLNDGSKCKCIIDKLDAFNAAVNRSQIPYKKLSTNSNAYAHAAIDAAGLRPPIPPLDVKGWNTPLPIKPLPKAPR